MITKNISRAGLFLFSLILIALPTTSQAYFSTGQTADAVTNNTALYSVTFYFGFADKDVYIPITTQRTTTNDITNRSVGYTFETREQGDPEAGVSAGIVISDADIVNGMYVVPAGHTKSFTLYTILTLDTNTPAEKYRMQVTNLPYTLVSDTKSQELGLGPTGLFAYRTKQVGLNLQ